jgi:hypothetical protein
MSNDNINQQINKGLDVDSAISALIFNRLLKIQRGKFPPSDVLDWMEDRLPSRLTGGGLCTSKKLWSSLLFLSQHGFIEIMNRKKIKILRLEE